MPRIPRCAIDDCDAPASHGSLCLAHHRASLGLGDAPRSVANELAGLPKSKLMDIARSVDLEGRSSMDHDELVDALVEHGKSAD